MNIRGCDLVGARGEGLCGLSDFAIEDCGKVGWCAWCVMGGF